MTAPRRNGGFLGFLRRAVAMLLPKEMTAEQAGTLPATVPSA